MYSRGGQVPVEDDVPMVHSLEPTLRNKYNIPTRIQAGKIVLDNPYLVCTEGEKLDVRQALILKQFGVAAAEFRVKVTGYYDNSTSTVKKMAINTAGEVGRKEKELLLLLLLLFLLLFFFHLYTSIWIE